MPNNKTGFAYYNADTDRFQDIRIKRLKKERGCNGFAVYEYILTEIYRVKGSVLVWDENTAFDVAEYWGLKESQVNDIVNFCCACGLFDKDLFASVGILTSPSIQSRYVEMCIRAKRKEIKIPEECLKLPEESLKMMEEYLKLPEGCDKVKKSKVKKEASPYGDTKKGVPGGTALSPAHSKDLLEKEIPVCKTELLSDTYWLEVLCMNNHLSMAQLIKLMDSFFAILQNRGETTKSVRDAKHHFASWLQIELNQKGGKNAGNATGMDGVKVQPANYGER